MTKVFYAALFTLDSVTFFAPQLAPTFFYYPPLIWVIGIFYPSILAAIVYEWAHKKKT